MGGRRTNHSRQSRAWVKRYRGEPKDRCLRLDDTRTGRSILAIGSIPCHLLTDWPPQVCSPFVSPGTRGNGETAYQGTKREVVKIMAAAEIADAGCHTLRHTFGSVASELGYSDVTIAGLLGHKGRGVTSRYVHRPDAALVAAAEAVSNRLAELMDWSAWLHRPSAGKRSFPL